LVSGSKDKTIKIWDHLTGALIKTLIGHKSIVNIVKAMISQADQMIIKFVFGIHQLDLLNKNSHNIQVLL
jgi:WD40 repeat protein